MKRKQKPGPKTANPLEDGSIGQVPTYEEHRQAVRDLVAKQLRFMATQIQRRRVELVEVNLDQEVPQPFICDLPELTERMIVQGVSGPLRKTLTLSWVDLPKRK